MVRDKNQVTGVSASYKLGFEIARDEAKTILVNGLDEFGHVGTFISFLINLLGTPNNVESHNQFFEGVVDAAKEVWDSARNEDIKELREIRDAVNAEIKEREAA
jgi:hypothetical protein